MKIGFKFKHYAFSGLKIIISAGLLVLALHTVDFSLISRSIFQLSAFNILLVLTILAAQFAAVALRTKEIMALIGEPVPYTVCLSGLMIGNFFGQTILNAAASDAIRVWCLTKACVSIVNATTGIVLDRALGLCSLLFLVCLALPGMWYLIDADWLGNASYAVAGTATCTILGIGVLILLSRRGLKLHIPVWLKSFFEKMGQVLRAPKAIPLFAIGLGIHLSNIGIFYILAQAIDIVAPLWAYLVMLPLPLFLSTLPISISGWGLREISVKIALGYIGLTGEQGVTLSLLFGTFLLIVSLPGGILLLIERWLSPAPVPAEPRQSDHAMDEDPERMR